MSDTRLEPKPVLGGLSRSFGDTVVEEIIGLSIVSIAVPRNGQERLNAALNEAWGIGFPGSAMSAVSEDGSARIVSVAPDQAFVLFDHAGHDGDLVIADKLGDAGYYTLQSDNWVALRLAGPCARAALERICQIDVSADRFGDQSVARTVTEHMGSIIIADGTDSFILLSAWSSAHAFAHAVETSVRNVI